METLRDLWLFMKERKKWWLSPVIVVLFLVGTFLVAVHGKAVSTLIYTLW